MTTLNKMHNFFSNFCIYKGDDITKSAEIFETENEARQAYRIHRQKINRDYGYDPNDATKEALERYCESAKMKIDIFRVCKFTSKSNQIKTCLKKAKVHHE